MSDAWMVTYSGRKVDLLEPSAEQIDIDDIAVHLARLNRFTGATLTPYTVAQHSVEVSYLCPIHPLAGLLHDAHEAYIGDPSRPFRQAMQSLGGGAAIREIERRLDLVIAAKFGVNVDVFRAHEVKHADNTLLATEKRDLVIPHAHEWTAPLPDPLPKKLTALTSWETAREDFLDRFLQLKGRG